MGENLVQRIKAVTVAVLIAAALIIVRMIFQGRLSSVEAFQEYMQEFGIFAPVMLVLIQAIQVIVPVLPGYLGCAAGAVAFGPVTGFWCNYIGICAGSIIAYFLARSFGIDLVLALFPEKMYDKWSKRVEKSRSYDVFLFAATLLPLFPDDFLCYFSGLMNMKARKFIWIILLGKPWCILAYSIFFGMLAG